LAKSYYEALQSSRGKRAAVAIAISVVAFWLQMLIGVSGADDDWAMSLFLSNAYPDSGYTLFIHPWMSAFVSFLFDVLPWGPNYFLILEIGLSCAATCVITYYALGHLNIGAAVCVVSVVILFPVPMCTQNLNFTSVTGLVACAGFVLLFVQLLEKRCNVVASVVGALFLCVACMLRFKGFLLCAPFALVLAIVGFVRSRDLQLKKRALLFVPLASSLALCGALAVSSDILMQQPDLKAWQDITLPRSDLADYPKKSYSEVADQLTEIGVSENDYWLATHWTMNDTSYFTAEKLRQIADIACVHPDMSPMEFVKSAGTYLLRLGGKPFVALVIAASVLLLFGSWRRAPRLEKWAAIGVLAITLCILAYLTAAGRMILRIEYPIWTYGLIALALPLGMGARGGTGLLPAHESGRAQAAAELARFAIAVLFVFLVGLVTFMEAIESPSELPMKSLLGDTLENESELLEYQADHADCVFAYDYNTFGNVGYLYERRGVPSKDLMRTIQNLGGWEYGATFLDEELAAKTGLDCGLFEAFAKSDKVFLVAGDDGYAKHVLEYIREHYDPTAELQVVETIRDSEMDKSFLVMRFVSAR